MPKNWFLVGLSTATILLAIVIGVAVYGYFQIQQVKGWYEQAYSAATAVQMSQWLGELVDAMEKEGMTQGHYALIFKNPHNNIALDLQVFENLRVRCLEVEKYPQGSMDYAESLEDIRRQMDHTDFNPWWWWMVNRANVFTWALVTSFIWFFAIFLGIWLIGEELSSYLRKRARTAQTPF